MNRKTEFEDLKLTIPLDVEKIKQNSKIGGLLDKDVEHLLYELRPHIYRKIIEISQRD